MRILSVRHSVPSLALGNEAAIDRLSGAAGGAGGTGSAKRDAIRDFLARAGSRRRYTLAPGETAFDVLDAAIRAALEDADIRPDEIDFIIYASVGRGWLEPSMACAVQRLIGAPNAIAFDVMEACAGWIRAMQIADAFFRAGTYRLGLIVNCECGLQPFGPAIGAPGVELAEQLAGFTIGEAAAATVVAAEVSDFYVTTRSYAEHCDLCMLPLENFASFQGPRLNGGHVHQFFSRSAELFNLTIRYLISAYQNDPMLRGRHHDIYFTHAASAKAGDLARRKLRIASASWYCTHADFGNTVSASIPLAISCAVQDGTLRRGMRMLAAVGSAGISVGLLSITY